MDITLSGHGLFDMNFQCEPGKVKSSPLNVCWWHLNKVKRTKVLHTCMCVLQMYVWENGDPVSYQIWMSTLTKTHSTIKHQKYTNMEGTFLMEESQINGTSHPYQPNSYSCTAMLLSNLAEPQWISIQCYQPLTDDVICDISGGNKTFNISFPTQELCLEGQIYRLNKCYSFAEKLVKHMIHHKCLTKEQIDIKIMHFLIHAISSTFPPILSCVSRDILVFDKIFGIWENTFGFYDSQKGLILSKFDMVEYSISGNLFVCNENLYISHLYVCDGISDCSDSLDESSCPEKVFCDLKQKFAAKGICNLVFFLAGHDVDKSKGLPSKRRQHHVFEKGNLTEEKVSFRFQNLMPRVEIEKNDCFGNGLLLCTRRDFNCYNISDICKYSLDVFDELIPCRFGEHLEDCKQYECNMMFKCPNYYCKASPQIPGSLGHDDWSVNFLWQIHVEASNLVGATSQ